MLIASSRAVKRLLCLILNECCKLVTVYFEEETSSLPNAALTQINAPVAILLLNLHARPKDWRFIFPPT
jgi:hypothetical protein